MRWLRRILALLLALIVLCAAGAWWLLAGSLAALDGNIQLDGLSAPVTIARDHIGVLDIKAGKHADLARALGFVHAQQRFFQMDLQRRVAAGELAALFGPAALDADLDHRRHRFRARARSALAQLPTSQRALLDAYSDGVNAGLAALHVRPWEYLLLGVRPQAWRSEDSLLTVDAMFLDLEQHGHNSRELDIKRLRAVLPRPLADFLMAADGNWEAPLQGDVTAPLSIPAAQVFDLRKIAPIATTTVAIPGTPAFPGSNSFAVGGALAGGTALLASDMHLALSVPNIWFRARLRYSADNGDRIDLNGLTLPGLPALLAGSNGHIAWSFTNSYGDWQDWVRIQRDPHNRERYRTPDGWQMLSRHAEHIEVKGQPTHTLQVEDSRWGPIMASDTDGTPLALHWIAHLARTHNLNLLQLDQANTVHAALIIAPGIGMPPQNFVVADAAGHIGWTLTGNALPLRAGFDPQVPADWSKQGTGWIGFASPLQYPRIEDPDNHRLWTANNRTTSGEWLNLLGNSGYDLGARARQIRNDLDARTHFSAEDMLAIQLDDRAVFLQRWQRLLQDTLRKADDPHLLALRQATRNWQGRAAIDSIDYRMVRAFRMQVSTAVLAPFAARVRKLYPAFRLPVHSEAAVWALLQKKPLHLLDPEYPDWNALLRKAARKVSQQFDGKMALGKASWGQHNHAHICHPLAAALPEFMQAVLCMPFDELPGDSNMPRVQSADFGASERMLIRPGHEARSILHMPGGQSDNPLSAYFGAGHEDWVHGRPTPLLPGPAEHRLTLTP